MPSFRTNLLALLLFEALGHVIVFVASALGAGKPPPTIMLLAMSIISGLLMWVVWWAYRECQRLSDSRLLDPERLIAESEEALTHPPLVKVPAETETKGSVKTSPLSLHVDLALFPETFSVFKSRLTYEYLFDCHVDESGEEIEGLVCFVNSENAMAWLIAAQKLRPGRDLSAFRETECGFDSAREIIKGRRLPIRAMLLLDDPNDVLVHYVR